MNKIILLVISLNIFSCASTQPVGGILYSDVSGPIATTHLQKGPLRGEACATSWVGAVAMGDASIAEAARSAGIAVISHVDQHSSSLLFFYNKFCTVVYGYRAPTKQ